ncbi:acyl carrier protein [Rubrivivax rivuli]|uniref:Acyl carrier protein n=1 Tax=Rubrivivax rivuli TaxID=1862385 RepID=A0A437RE68_9BURK|nr:acyl carrier protein [Rubrivivax rivuli]RVU45051.1 acyl carrier protein [Rubrivivax rivuli]
MSKSNDDVFAVVKKHLTEICPDIAPEQVTRGVSMKALGASSLDMVEVVSCSMRELAVRISRQELSDLKDIGGLVDLLHEAVVKKAG